MSAESAVLAGRAAAEGLMVDSCVITRGTSGTVYNEGSDSYASTPGATVYTGPCRVKPRDNVDRQVEAGGETVTIWPYVVSVPMTTTGIALNDTVTITAASLDPELVGLVLRVRSVPAGSHLTARRLGCEETD